MKFSKLVTIICILCLVLSTTLFSLEASAEENNIIFNDGKTKITKMVDDGVYSKIKIEDLEKGTVEYVESFNENGEISTKILSEDNEVIHTITKEGEELFLDGESMGDVLEQNKISYTILKNFDYETQAITWKYLSASYGNTSFRVMEYTNMVTIIAAAIAPLIGLPAWAALTIGLATNMASLEIDTVWWKKLNYVDANANFNTCKTAKITHFYKISNYTGYIDDTGLLVDAIDPCSSGY